MKKYLGILLSIVGAIVAYILGTRKSDRELNVLRKEAKEMDKKLEQARERSKASEEKSKASEAKSKASEAKSKVSEAQADESINKIRDSFGHNVDDVLRYVKGTGK